MPAECTEVAFDVDNIGWACDGGVVLAGADANNLGVVALHDPVTGETQVLDRSDTILGPTPVAGTVDGAIWAPGISPAVIAAGRDVAPHEVFEAPLDPVLDLWWTPQGLLAAGFDGAGNDIAASVAWIESDGTVRESIYRAQFVAIIQVWASGDGRQVLVAVNQRPDAPGGGSHWVDQITDGTQVRIPLPGIPSQISMTADGRTIAYRDVLGEPRFVTYDVATGLTTVIAQGEGVSAGVVSPDGDLAWARRAPGQWRSLVCTRRPSGY